MRHSTVAYRVLRSRRRRDDPKAKRMHDHAWGVRAFRLQHRRGSISAAGRHRVFRELLEASNGLWWATTSRSRKRWAGIKRAVILCPGATRLVVPVVTCSKRAFPFLCGPLLPCATVFRGPRPETTHKIHIPDVLLRGSLLRLCLSRKRKRSHHSSPSPTSTHPHNGYTR